MATGTETETDIHASFEEAIKLRDTDRIEELWDELSKGLPANLDLLLNYSDRIAQTGRAAEAALLLQTLVPDLQSAEAYKGAYQILRKAAEFAPKDRDVRGLLLDCIKHLHAANPLFEKALETSGLHGRTDMRPALKVFESYICVAEGVSVYHEAGWGVGKISEINAEAEEIYIDFLTKKNHRMTLSAMGTMLVPLPDDHYRVLMAYEPEKLKEMAKENPAEVIKKVVREEGRSLNVRQVKSLIVGDLIPSSSWTRLWTAAKSKLRRDPNVSLGSGNNPTIEIRQVALTYEDQMLGQFEKSRSVSAKIAKVREYLAHKSEKDAQVFVVPAITHLLAAIAGGCSPAEQFSVLLLYRECQGTLPENEEFSVPPVDEFIRQVEDIPGMLEEVTVTDYTKECVPLIKEVLAEEWPQLFEKILLSRCPQLWDLVYRGLYTGNHQDRIRSAFREVVRTRTSRPENFIWFCRSVLIGRIEPNVLLHSRADFFEDLIMFLDWLGSQRGFDSLGKESRTFSSTVRHIIFQDLGDRTTRLFEEAGVQKARHLLDIITHNRGLTDEHRVWMETRAYMAFPMLDVEEKKLHEEENVIYATEAGINRHEDELHRLVQTELPQVARDIGHAKEFGDLSENAEYAASLEKQSQLAAKAQQMEAELKTAKRITPEMVSEEEVSIGTRVTLRNTERGFLETYTILGPWDADSDNNIISYRAALAQGILGLKKGDSAVIELPDRTATYEVMAIVNAVS